MRLFWGFARFGGRIGFSCGGGRERKEVIGKGKWGDIKGWLAGWFG